MDLIASSPSEIRVTVDLAAFPSAGAELSALCAELAEVCRPRVVSRVGCVSLVGAGAVADLLRGARGLDALADVHVHLVHHAANGGHVSFVVDEAEIDELVAAAHDRLVAGAASPSVFGPGWDELDGSPSTGPIAAEEGIPCAAS